MASTCFNMLKLTSYSSEKQLKDKLLIAIRHGAEGFSFSWPSYRLCFTERDRRNSEISKNFALPAMIEIDAKDRVLRDSPLDELQIQLYRS